MKTSDDFVHLHVRSEYTLLASTLRCRDLAEQTAGLGMPAVALTDRGTLAGLFEFQREARRAGIKPIPGYEACLAPGSRLDKKEIDGRARTTKLTLLAQNDRGWANLLKLANRGGLEGEYRGRPRIDRELLRAHAEGMICLTGGSAGPVNAKPTAPTAPIPTSASAPTPASSPTASSPPSRTPAPSTAPMMSGMRDGAETQSAVAAPWGLCRRTPKSRPCVECGGRVPPCGTATPLSKAHRPRKSGVALVPRLPPHYSKRAASHAAARLQNGIP